jgi:hypothetical protein
MMCDMSTNILVILGSFSGPGKFREVQLLRSKVVFVMACLVCTALPCNLKEKFFP